MIHIRAVSPTDVTPRLVDLLGSNGGVVNLVVLQGVAHNPDGDSLQFDVITAEATRCSTSSAASSWIGMARS